MARDRTDRCAITGPGPAPTLDELAAEPAKALHLSAEVRSALLVRCASVLAALAVPVNEPKSNDRDAGAAEGWLTVPDVASRLGFAESYVYALARRGDLPSVRQGKYVRIPATALHEWMTKLGQLDGAVSTVLSIRREGHRGAAAPRTGRVATG